MYRLARVHFVTDRQTDRRHYHANSLRALQQYVWLITKQTLLSVSPTSNITHSTSELYYSLL